MFKLLLVIPSTHKVRVFCLLTRTLRRFSVERGDKTKRKVSTTNFVHCVEQKQSTD